MPNRLAISLKGIRLQMRQRRIMPGNTTPITTIFQSMSWAGLRLKREAAPFTNYAMKWFSFRCKSMHGVHKRMTEDQNERGIATRRIWRMHGCLQINIFYKYEIFY
ncbi:hypothetical protein [Janthinobacterium sp.]|uniref:hypothetical protein n=1 Tax=Janthinobacterium sp. TaxID=1871054 RepID=UPI002588D949|nr:hypothetical protein [Janthinobacterium sp.]MCX7294161.1 hypothetical protein [Janthinobacterium sp.]